MKNMGIFRTKTYLAILVTLAFLSPNISIASQENKPHYSFRCFSGRDLIKIRQVDPKNFTDILGFYLSGVQDTLNVIFWAQKNADGIQLADCINRISKGDPVWVEKTFEKWLLNDQTRLDEPAVVLFVDMCKTTCSLESIFY